MLERHHLTGDLCLSLLRRRSKWPAGLLRTQRYLNARNQLFQQSSHHLLSCNSCLLHGPCEYTCRRCAVLQALNNWGLVLQELSGMRPPAERHYLVQHSVAKFHRAVRLRPDFDRACYNLGTVLYAYACALQSDASQHLSSQLTQASTGLLAVRAAGPAELAFLQTLVGCSPTGLQLACMKRGPETSCQATSCAAKTWWTECCSWCVPALRGQSQLQCVGSQLWANAHICPHMEGQLHGCTTSLLCSQDPQAQDRERTDEQHTRRTFAQAAQYIMLSYVQQPSKEVYRKSLQVAVSNCNHCKAVSALPAVKFANISLVYAG